MKTMTCKQLGGSCDMKFQANTFDEIGELSKIHAKEMFEKQDLEHLDALYKMSELMKDNSTFINWLSNKKEEFANLPED